MKSVRPGLATTLCMSVCGWLGCSGAAGTSMGVIGTCTPSGNHAAQFVMSQAKIPMDNMQYSLDLDGDGKKDNKLGLILSALKSTSKGVDPEASINSAIRKGTFAFLLELVSADATFQSDSCMATHAETGTFAGSGMPMLDGSDLYMANRDVAVAAMTGALAQGAFASADPLASTTPIELKLFLPIASGAPPLEFDIVSAQLQLTVAADGKTLHRGELHGAVRKSDVDSKVAPGLAAIFNAVLNDSMGMASTKKSVADLFDSGSGTPDPACGDTCTKKDLCCKNPDGSCSQPSDGKIDICEVSTQSAIVNILDPDVKLFDAQGHYKPVAGAPAAEKDCLSLGLGFDAVAASF